MNLTHLHLDNTWTLFLDRDGVINERVVGDYVKEVDAFVFTQNALQAIQKLSTLVGKTIVVTNQQGIGKGLYTHDALAQVHTHMLHHVTNAGGKIDAVYYAPHLAAENNVLRKPNIGMPLQAQAQFTEINFTKSIMVGDSLSDMQMGRNIGAVCIWVGTDAIDAQWYDYAFKSLADFAACEF
jgi:histidinol-phosphate phosphatase family protein